ncbi:thiol reductant ABC exporter subunit CydC [soil metagenome]
MSRPARPIRPGADLIPRRSVYIIGVLSAVKALGLVLLAESIARGLAAMAAGDPDWRYAVLLGILAAVLRAAASWATSVAAARAAIGTKEDLRARLAGRLVEGVGGTGSQATLATRGLDDLDDYFVNVLPATAGAAVIPLLIGARIFLADWVSVLIILLTVPLIPVFMALVGQYTQAKSDAAASALDRLSNHIVELARGLPVLVGLGRMEEQARSLRRISDEYRITTMRTLRTAFLSSFVLELISTISVALVAVFVGIRILGGGLSLETGLVVLILAPECYAPFRDLGAAYHSSRAGRTALARVSDLLAAPQPPQRTARHGSTAAAHLGVVFAGRTPILRDISFTVPETGITALVGPSGSGKSTLLRALAGRLPADATLSGQVFVADPAAVAWAPQHPRTVAATVRVELELYSAGVPDAAAAVTRLLTALALTAVADTDPAQLSPGELRRLAVGRALLRVDAGATLLLLDEPTAHLDDASARAVTALIRAAGDRTAVIVASHDSAVTGIATARIQLGTAGAQRSRDDVLKPALPVADSTSETTPAVAVPLARTVRAFGAFLRPAAGRYLGAAGLGTLAAAFAIALTTVSAWLIVRAGEHPAIMYLMVAIVGVRFFGLGRAALRYSERLVTHDAVFASATDLRMRLWSALARRGATSRKLQRGGTALDLLVAATDDVRDLVPRVFVPAVVGLAIGVGALVTAWLVLPASVGVILGVLAASLVVAPALAVLADRSAAVSAQLMRSSVLRGFAALLDAADDLRGNGIDSIVRADLRAADERIGRASRRTASSRGLGAAIVVLAGCLGAIAMLVVGAPAVASGALAVELEAVLVLLPIAMIDVLLGFVGAVQHLPALRAALERTSALDDEETAVQPATIPAIAPVRELALESLAATWPGADRPAFSDVTARVEPDRWLVVEGPSGSGKSTMLTVLLGSLHPSAGTVWLDSTAEVAVDPTELHGHIVWCPQEAHLFDSTLRGNLLLGRGHDDPPTDSDMAEALRVSGLGALLDALPDGLDTRIGSEGSHLSGGERQRVAVARTVLSSAEIVLLDEPTAHLDEDTAERLMADLRVAFAGRIVVLVTHHADELHADDELVVLGSHQLVTA